MIVFFKLFAIVSSVALMLASVLGVSLLLSLPMYLLWNYCLVGAVTGVLPVTWLTAWGINILCALLFKNISISTK